VSPTAIRLTHHSSITLVQGNANGPENTAHQVTWYTDARNAKVKAKTGSEQQHLHSRYKAVTTGAVSSKNAFNAQTPMHIVEVVQLPTKGLAQLVNQSREQSKVLAVQILLEIVMGTI